MIGGIFRQFWSPDFPPTWIDRTNQGYLRYMLRLPGLIFTGLLAFAVYRVVKREWGQKLALASSAAYLFNAGEQAPAGRFPTKPWVVQTVRAEQTGAEVKVGILAFSGSAAYDEDVG